MIKRKINLGQQEVEYKLNRRVGNRYLRLAMKTNGDIIVSAPKYFPLYLVNKFITSRRDWISQALVRLQSDNSLFRKKFSRIEIDSLKKQTLHLVKERLDYFNQFYHLKFNKIAIRNQSTRWGSCSRRGNLNFNCRLCLLPSELFDYIIVHELCHLQEMNHSTKFWNLVARLVPEHKKLRAKLRQF